MERKITILRARRFPLHEGEGTGKLNLDHSGAMPNARWYPSMDVYGHYRAMVMAASLPNDPEIPAYGPMADHPFSSAYTSVDQEIIDRASKLCGFPASKLSDEKSREGKDINVKSPTNHNSGRSIYAEKIDN